jgi:AcrR family transcriptional regulator
VYDADKYRSKATRLQPSQERGKERVRIILAAALELFQENGFEEVTTNDIASRAHIPIGSLYRYYPNKEAIVAALTELYVDDVSVVFDKIGQHPLLPYLSWDEILLLMVEGWVNYSRLNGPFAFLYVERSNPKIYEQNRKTWQRFIGSFVAVLQKRCPELRPKQSLICFNLCLAAVEMGVNKAYSDFGGDAMYHEAVGAIASYMLRICGSSDHHEHTDILA